MTIFSRDLNAVTELLFNFATNGSIVYLKRKSGYWIGTVKC